MLTLLTITVLLREHNKFQSRYIFLFGDRYPCCLRIPLSFCNRCQERGPWADGELLLGTLESLVGVLESIVGASGSTTTKHRSAEKHSDKAFVGAYTSNTTQQ